VVVAQYNIGKREHSSLAQGQGDQRGTLSAGRRKSRKYGNQYKKDKDFKKEEH
jgi:hypothetical protein